jgi:hypothetical protein
MAKILLYPNSDNGWSLIWFYDHRFAYKQGNEIGNHTATHIHIIPSSQSLALDCKRGLSVKRRNGLSQLAIF